MSKTHFRVIHSFVFQVRISVACVLYILPRHFTGCAIIKRELISHLWLRDKVHVSAFILTHYFETVQEVHPSFRKVTRAVTRHSCSDPIIFSIKYLGNKRSDYNSRRRCGPSNLIEQQSSRKALHFQSAIIQKLSILPGDINRKESRL